MSPFPRGSVGWQTVKLESIVVSGLIGLATFDGKFEPFRDPFEASQQ